MNVNTPEGTVQRIVNGKMLPQPLLQVPVSTTSERGMLGIAVAKHANGISSSSPTYVFLSILLESIYPLPVPTHC